MATDRSTAVAAEGADLLALVELALEEARVLGASQAEAAVSMDVGLSVSVRLGEVETIEYQRDRGMAVTVYFDSRKGTASTADLGADALRETVAKALQHRALHRGRSLCGARRSGHARDVVSGPRPRPPLGHHARARLRARAGVRGRGPGGRSAHHELRGRGRQHASRRARLRQLARLPRRLPGHGAQPELRRDRHRRRGDGARLLVHDRARLARSSRPPRPSAGTAASAPCSGSAPRQLGTMRVPVLFAPEVARGLVEPLRRRGARRQPVPSRLVPARRGGPAGVPGLVRDLRAAAPAAGARERALRPGGRRDPRPRARGGRRAARLRARHLLGAQARAAYHRQRGRHAQPARARARP